MSIRSSNFREKLEEFYEKLLREPLGSFKRTLGQELQTVHRILNNTKEEQRGYESVVEQVTFLCMFFAFKVRRLIRTDIDFALLTETQKKRRWKTIAQCCLYLLHMMAYLMEEDEFTGNDEDLRECHLEDETDNGIHYEHWSTGQSNEEDDVAIQSDSDDEARIPLIEP